MTSRILAPALAALALAAATSVPAQSIAGFISDDCVNLLDVQAQRSELYGFKFGTSRTPDVLYDATANGGANTYADLTGSSWNIDPAWRVTTVATDRGASAITMAGGRVVLDSGSFLSFAFAAAKPQPVGSIDGVAPQVSATSFGYEVRFHPLAQLTPDIVATCSVAGDPGANLRPIAGYAIYRLPAGSSPTLAQFRQSGYVGFLDSRRFDFAAADPDGYACSDLASGDEALLLNPNGVVDDGDEVVVFRDTTRTPSGRPRANAASALASYVYRVQPVIDQDIAQYATGIGVGNQGDPATAVDRDGNGTKESVDLRNDGWYEIIDPGMTGMGLTYGGEILSSPQPGTGVPLAGLVDPDGDGIPSPEEIALGLDPAVSNGGLDTDGDGPLDRLEAESGADPLTGDSDGSGERDGREMFYGRSARNRCDDIAPARPLGDISPVSAAHAVPTDCNADGDTTDPGEGIGGRCSGDGLVTVSDAVRALRISVGLESAGAVDTVMGDVAPAELASAGTSPPTWRRHGLPDTRGEHPYGYFEHGDGLVDVGDAVVILRQSVGLLRVTD